MKTWKPLGSGVVFGLVACSGTPGPGIIGTEGAATAPSPVVKADADGGAAVDAAPAVVQTGQSGDDAGGGSIEDAAVQPTRDAGKCSVDVPPSDPSGQCGGKGGGSYDGIVVDSKNYSGFLAVGSAVCGHFATDGGHMFTVTASLGECLQLDFSSTISSLVITGAEASYTAQGEGHTTFVGSGHPVTILVSAKGPDAYTLTLR